MLNKILIIFLFTLHTYGSYHENLNQSLHHFEELVKDNVHIEMVANSRIPNAKKIYVRIVLQDTVLEAAVQPHSTLFHPELVVKHIYADGERVGSLNSSEYLEGHLLDKSDTSRVLIHVKDNIITGTIQLSDQETYFIEPSHRHIKEPHDFHMIVYKLSDVKFNSTRNGNDKLGHFCSSDLRADHTKFSDLLLSIPSPYEKERLLPSRMKRSSITKKHCSLALVADYGFYSLNSMNEGNTIHYMLSIIQQVDDIFKKQSFGPHEAEQFMGFGFTVKYIEVIMDPGEKDPESYKYAGFATRDHYELLKSFSHGQWRPEFCLAHLFTNYDFENGVLGLAYTAGPSVSKLGGICSRQLKNKKTGSLIDVNTGLTTVVNFGRTVLSSEVVIVTAHEFGHNWGCPHDSDTSKECAPANNRYIMYPSAVDGSRPNNYKFSPCCRKAISDVLETKANACFTEVITSTCGNGVVEEGETCDPGMEDSSCCISCQLTKGSSCEPANDECCGQEGSAHHCKLHIGKMCHLGQQNSCHVNRTCQKNDISGDVLCTLGVDIEDGESCFDNGKCKSGECLDHCIFFNKYPCICSEKEDYCKQCCKDTDDGKCQPLINDEAEVKNLTNGKICGDGACVDGVCVVGAQDVQERLWEIYHVMEVDKISQWFKDNIVFTIIVSSMIFWIPLSMCLNILDQKFNLSVNEDDKIYTEFDDLQFVRETEA